MTGRAESPLWLQRLWAHCQTAKAWEFTGLSAANIKAICAVPADVDATAWVKALVKCRFVVRRSQNLRVHDWEVLNAGLINSWENGRKGGRPSTPAGRSRDLSKAVTGRHGETHGIPAAIPPAAHVEPTANLAETDREDRVEGVDELEGRDRNDLTTVPDGPRPQSDSQAILYAKQISLPENEAKKFYDHYSGNGWHQGGGAAIVSWQAQLRTWHRRWTESVAGKVHLSALSAPRKFWANTGGMMVYAPATDQEIRDAWDDPNYQPKDDLPPRPPE